MNLNIASLRPHPLIDFTSSKINKRIPGACLSNASNLSLEAAHCNTLGFV